MPPNYVREAPTNNSYPKNSSELAVKGTGGTTVRDPMISLQNPTRFRNAKKRNAAQVRAVGGTQAEAAQAAGVTRQTVSLWERTDDREYWYWFSMFDDWELRGFAARGRKKQREILQGRLSRMNDQQREEYCQRNGFTAWQFEQLLSAEENRIVRVANQVTQLRTRMKLAEDR